jgi:hypothetical protein
MIGKTSRITRGGRAIKVLLVIAGVSMAAFVAELALRAYFAWNTRRALEQMAEHTAPEAIDTPQGVLGPGVRLSEYPNVVYEVRPNLRGTYDGRHFSSNRHGFRHDREFRIDKPPGVRRIVGVGDSWMWGSGVHNGENYLDRLADLLSGEGQHIQVINTAVWGYNARQQISTLQHKGLVFSPDIVVVGLCGNDREYPAFLEHTPWVTPTRSFLWNEIAGRLGWASPPEPPQPGELMPFAELEEAYEKLADLAGTERFHVVVFSDCFAGDGLPRQSGHCQLGTEQEWQRLMKRFDEWRFRRCVWNIESLPQNPAWGHATAEGNRQLAAVLAACVRPLLATPR